MIVRFGVLVSLLLVILAPVGSSAVTAVSDSPGDVISEEISSGPTLPYTIDVSVKEMPKPEAQQVPSQPAPPESPPVDDKGWTEAQAPPPVVSEQQPQKDDKQQQPPQMPQPPEGGKQPPNQQNGAPLKPAQPATPSFQCTDPPPADPSKTCKPGCGYDNCIFKFTQEQGPINCPLANTLKQQCDLYKSLCISYLLTPTQCGLRDSICPQYQIKKQECCKAHKAAEAAQIATQTDPCGAAANLASGGFLTPYQIMQCKANALNRCKITDKSQLDKLKQDPDFRKSLGNNPNDISTAKDMMQQNSKLGDMSDALKKQAMQKMVMDLAKQGMQAAFQGGGAGSDSKGFQTSSGGSTYQVDNNEFATADLKTGDSLTLNQKDGSAQLQRSGDQVAVMARESAPSAVPVSYSSTNGMLMASSSMTGVFSGAANEGILNSPQYYMDVYPKIPASSLSPLVPDSITGSAIVSNVLYYAIVRFFPGEPRIASMGEIHAGQVAQGWVAVIPRANARIDFHAASGFITNKVMGMGIPRGSSLMVSSKNLEEESILNYLIDGVKDYDFIIANGLTIWPYSGTSGGKIISSSYGIPPDQYLSKQQREMVYG